MKLYKFKRIEIKKIAGIYFITFFLTFTLHRCDSKTQYKGVIQADLSSLPTKFNKVAILMEKAENRGDSLKIEDTIDVNNGKFKYQFKLKQPRSVYFTLLQNTRKVGELSFEDGKIKKGMFLANPIIGNEHISFTYREDKHKENKDLPKNVHIVQIEGAEENRMFQKTFFNNLLNKKFIKENSSSYSLLWQMLEYSDKYTAKQLEVFSSNLSPELKKSPSFKILEKIIYEKRDVEKNGFVINFDWTDINGKKYNFEQARNGKKKILLIFWASWCIPCRKEIPNLKEFYNIYSKDISMISLSIDNDYYRWKKAVDQEKMPWLNLSGLPKSKNAIMLAYDLKAVPTLILLNEKGEIIRKKTNDLHTIIDMIKNKE